VKLAATVLSALLLLVIWPQTSAAQAQQKPEELAQKSAEAWLALADSGKYAETWDEASQYFKNAVTKDRWLSAMKSARAPLGSLISRKLTSAQYTKTVPGAPDGRYVILKYATGFENKKDSVETITPMLDKDGKWRVSGYFIK
jgi:Protein of unknown function (DUF4019)